MGMNMLQSGGPSLNCQFTYILEGTPIFNLIYKQLILATGSSGPVHSTAQ